MARKWLGNRPYTEYTSTTGGTGLVTYDATGAGNAVASGSNSVNITWNHTVGAGSNRVLTVSIMVGGLSALSSTFTRTCTYGGVSMTSLGPIDNTSNGNNGFVDIYFLAAPTTGTATVSFTVTKAATTFGRVAGNSVSYANAVQTAPISGLGIAGGSSINPNQSKILWSSASQTYNAGCMMVGVYAVDSLRTITSVVTNNALFAVTSFPNQGTTRWTSNSGATTGQTSVAIADAPGMMYQVFDVTASGAAFNIGLVVVLSPIGTAVPTGIRGCLLTMIGTGGGGGSGRRDAAATARAGGDGGGGGAFIASRYIPAAALGSTYSVYVPAVASGGAAQTVNTTNGNPGVRNPDVMFSSGNITISAGSGHGGYGGTNATSSGADGGLTADQSGYGGAGGAGSATTGATGTSGYWGNHATTAGGGAGGGITAANVNTNGGAGGDFRMLALAGGAAGVTGGASPGAGSAATVGLPGSGAGGGGSSTTTTAQSGATATAYGGGGGGGGASVNGQNSGAGGNGGPGYVRIMWDYR